MAQEAIERPRLSRVGTCGWCAAVRRCLANPLHTNIPAAVRRPPQPQLTRSPATFQLRMRHALASSASGGGRMLASHAGPAGALGLAGARFALGLAALAEAPSLAAAAAAAAGLPACASSGGATALRLGALSKGGGRGRHCMRLHSGAFWAHTVAAPGIAQCHKLFATSHGGTGGASDQGAEGKLGLGATRQQGQHARGLPQGRACLQAAAAATAAGVEQQLAGSMQHQCWCGCTTLFMRLCPSQSVPAASTQLEQRRWCPRLTRAIPMN